MSQERRKKQQKRQGQSYAQPNPEQMRYALVAIVIVVIFAIAYYFLWHRHNTKLDAFAQCLTAKQAKMYGAFWCPHCEDQREKFGSSFKYAPYVECGIKGSQGIQAVCTQAGIKRFPTWVFADGTRVEGEHDLQFLGDQTGCSAP